MMLFCEDLSYSHTVLDGEVSDEEGIFTVPVLRPGTVTANVELLNPLLYGCFGRIT